MARCGEGSIVAPGAWKWPSGLVRAARRGLGLPLSVFGAEVLAAVGAVTAAAQWWYWLRTRIGYGDSR
jgi:hypothetical protein